MSDSENKATAASKRSRPAERAGKSSAGDLPEIQAMEAFVAKLGQRRAEEATDRAQDLAYDAWDVSDPGKRTALLHRALAASPLCADAWVLLGQDAATPDQALELYRMGVRAGELALGPAQFEEMAGEFWGWMETRPYMRARHFLGLTLAGLGRHAEAIENYAGMLALNPNDNQGIRYLLLDALLAEGRHAEADALWKQYRDDDTAHWTYSRAILLFRTKGDTAAARTALNRARAVNAYVPSYLSGARKLPKRLPDYIGLGDETEAAAYAAESGALWRATPGALEWMAASPAGVRAKGPQAH